MSGTFHQFRTSVKETKTEQLPRSDIRDLDLHLHLEELIYTYFF